MQNDPKDPNPKRRKNQTMRKYKDSKKFQAWKLRNLRSPQRIFKVNRLARGENKIYWVQALNGAQAARLVDEMVPKVSINAGGRN